MRDAPRLFARALQFSVIGMKNVDKIVHRYSGDSGVIPGGLPVASLYCYEWARCLTFLERYVTPPTTDRSLPAPERLFKAFWNRFRLLRDKQIDPYSGLDLWC